MTAGNPATNVQRGRLADRSKRLPEGYVRPKRRPPARERLTIGKLIYATTCFAMAFYVYPLVYLYPPWLIWCLICGFVGSAIGYIRSGTEGAVFGFIIGLFFMPVGYVCLLLVGVLIAFLYILFTDAKPSGLMSYHAGAMPSLLACVDLAATSNVV